MGLEAKEFLTRRLNDAMSTDSLKVQTEKDGKYGRMLGWLYCGETNLNIEMVDRGYAWYYDGGSKNKDLNELKVKRGVNG